MTLSSDDTRRYLALLDVPAGAPTLRMLKAIVRAHLWRVPFENISKLYRMKTAGLKGTPPIGEFLDGIERQHFGGTCYTNNYYLNGLLSSLGFDAVLCGAVMHKPDVHIVSMVRLEGREYIVDAGNAAPFIEPMPCDVAEAIIIPWGADRYILHPKNADGWPRVSVVRDGEHKPQYTVNPAPRHIEEFGTVIADSFRPEATFMNAVLVARFAAERSTVLRNLKLTVVDGTDARRMMYRSVAEIVPVIEEYFGIPASISDMALEGWKIDHRAFN
jgi:N-hydroxyarylamine O-acetyltransferase